MVDQQFGAVRRHRRSRRSRSRSSRSILWFTRYGTIFAPDWRVKTFCFALIFACLLIPVGTSTRTGLLCIGLLALLMLRDVEAQARCISRCSARSGWSRCPFLPSAFTDRMRRSRPTRPTNPPRPGSRCGNGRRTTPRTHPFGGGFEAYRQNQIRYDIVKVGRRRQDNAKLDTTLRSTRRAPITSAYFEMLGEQGYPGLVLWLVINLIGLFRMEVLRRRYRKATGDDRLGRAARQRAADRRISSICSARRSSRSRSSRSCYMLIGAQIGLDTYLARKRAETRVSADDARRAGRSAAGAGMTGSTNCAR